ncbi:unnamed protein product, partial [marine sediment metagenome]
VCCAEKEELIEGYKKARGLDLSGVNKEEFYLDNFKDRLNKIYELAFSL